MRPIQPVILALTFCLIVGAAAAETRNARPITHTKKSAGTNINVGKPLHNAIKPLQIAPIKGTALPRTSTVHQKIVKTAKAKKKVAVALPLGRRPMLVKRVGTPKHLRVVIPRKIDEVPREPVASTVAFGPITLTKDQKDSIYRVIADIPLKPRSVTTERVLPPQMNVPNSARPPVELKRIPGVAEPAPVVGAPVPPSVTLYEMPLRAAEAVPEIGTYRYAFVGERVLLVDPATHIVVAAINP